MSTTFSLLFFSSDLLSTTMKKTKGGGKGGKTKDQTKNLNNLLHRLRVSIKKYSCSETFKENTKGPLQ